MEERPECWPLPLGWPAVGRGALHHTVLFYLCKMGFEIPQIYSEARADGLREKTKIRLGEWSLEALSRHSRDQQKCLRAHAICRKAFLLKGKSFYNIFWF